MEREMDIFDRMKSGYSKMSKGQKRIADFIIANYDKAVFMTAGKLAMSVNVSESTVVRFASSLGYDGYPHMQRILQDTIKTKLTTVQRMEHSKEQASQHDMMKDLMYQDVENIRRTIDEINPEKMQLIGRKIRKARKVFIIGFRSSKVLAEYLAFYLNFIHEDVKYIPHGANDIYDQLINATPSDLVIVITFPRYSKRTVDVVKYLSEEHIPLLGITDSYNSPITNLVDDVLTAKYNMETFIDSLVAPMSLLNALIIAMSLDNQPALERKFDRIEKIWEDYKIYL